MKWIRIAQQPRDGTKKTSVYDVRTADEIQHLGEIRFYPRWRKYAFYPRPDTLYEQDCLRDIAQFCEESTAQWRKGLKAMR